MISILFVCMGNICRSPTAQGVFSKLAREYGLDGTISVDSAGTHAYHLGHPPDIRAQEAAARRNVELSDQRARQVQYQDFQRFDYILAMDRENLDILTAMCPTDMRSRIHLFLDFAPHLQVQEMPDPYFGGKKGFEEVLDLTESAAYGLLHHIRKNHLRESG